jgi:hypothetical protein
MQKGILEATQEPLLPLCKITYVCLKPFKLRFWEIGPEALEALGLDL